MKTVLSFVIVAGLAVSGLAGCATPFRAPSDMAHVKLERVDSSLVSVEKIWLEREKGRLVLRGDVIKQLGTTDTTTSHLEVTLFSAGGQVLRRSVEYFTPRQIPHGHRMHGHSQYRIVLDPLPPDTARIEVRAHDGGIPALGS